MMDRGQERIELVQMLRDAVLEVENAYDLAAASVAAEKLSQQAAAVAEWWAPAA